LFGLDAWSISLGLFKEHKGAKMLRHNTSQGWC